MQAWEGTHANDESSLGDKQIKWHADMRAIVLWSLCSSHHCAQRQNPFSRILTLMLYMQFKKVGTHLHTHYCSTTSGASCKQHIPPARAAQDIAGRKPTRWSKEEMYSVCDTHEVPRGFKEKISYYAARALRYDVTRSGGAILSSDIRLM